MSIKRANAGPLSIGPILTVYVSVLQLKFYRCFRKNYPYTNIVKSASGKRDKNTASGNQEVFKWTT